MNCLRHVIRSRPLLLIAALVSVGWCSSVRADGGNRPQNNKPVARQVRILAVRVVLRAPKIRAAQPQKAKKLPAGKRRIHPARRFIPISGAGGFGFAGRSTKVSLVRNAQVQDELKLTDAQKQKVREMFKSHQERLRGLFGGLQGLNADQRQKKLKEIRKKMQASSAKLAEAVGGVLKPEQSRRLDEIFLQLRGLYALRDSAVAKRLKLTSEQQTKIADLFKSQVSKRQALYRGLRGKGLTPDQRRKKFKEFREKRQKLVKQTEQQVAAVLTKPQQAQLKTMKGKKFKLDQRRVPRLKLKVKRAQPKAKRAQPKAAA